ncbi:MAG: beta-ketoacyl-[acyl-carrier-protein] synthase family protein [Verrucomicrobiales bacterium]|jgi:3-oxoacyl-(acyl-carrier-protein) synthase|nr:beta-ketoacyl-[acyl-carrier-protein] synthase family protein [Verrucomicrobiales bacterium]
MNVIVGGYGCVSAAGENLAALSAALFDGRPARPMSPARRVNSVYAAEYPAFLVSETLTATRRADESLSLLFLRTAIDEALTMAALSAAALRGLRVGVCVGSSVEASFIPLEHYRTARAGQPLPPGIFARFVTASLSDRVLAHYGWSGISQTVVTACASGTDAIGIGAEWIATGACDAVIAGGADEFNAVPYTGFIRLMIASKAPCRPFAKDRAGINLGEGAGALLLLSPSAAEKFGVTPRGRVLGYGNAADGYHATAPEPGGRGLRQAIAGAMTQARVSAADLAFVNAHGTGTADNDAAEAAVFNDLLPGVAVSATKDRTGHTLAAAGAVEAVITLLALERGEIPAVNFPFTPDEKLGLTPLTVTQKIPADKTAALSDSLAFGGINAALVLGRA